MGSSVAMVSELFYCRTCSPVCRHGGVYRNSKGRRGLILLLGPDCSEGSPPFCSTSLPLQGWEQQTVFGQYSLGTLTIYNTKRFNPFHIKILENKSQDNITINEFLLHHLINPGIEEITSILLQQQI